MSDAVAVNRPFTLGAPRPLLSDSLVPTVYPTVGQVLFTSDGTWLNDPVAFGYQWQISNDGVAWENATGIPSDESMYVVAVGDEGDYLRVAVMAYNAVGTGVQYSVATVPVPETAVIAFDSVMVIDVNLAVPAVLFIAVGDGMTVVDVESTVANSPSPYLVLTVELTTVVDSTAAAESMAAVAASTTTMVDATAQAVQAPLLVEVLASDSTAMSDGVTVAERVAVAAADATTAADASVEAVQVPLDAEVFTSDLMNAIDVTVTLVLYPTLRTVATVDQTTTVDVDAAALQAFAVALDVALAIEAGSVANPSTTVQQSDSVSTSDVCAATVQSAAARTVVGSDLTTATDVTVVKEVTFAAGVDLASISDVIVIAETALPFSGYARPGGGNWTLQFYDDFPGTTLDSTKWAARTGFVGNGATDTSANITVANSVCTVALPSGVNAGTGGFLTSNPAYGASPGYMAPVGSYVEFYAYMPGDGADVGYNWNALWTYGNSWPVNGEIDIAECSTSGTAGMKSNYWYGTSGNAKTYAGTAPSGSWTNAYHYFAAYRGASSFTIFWDTTQTWTHASSDSGGAHGLTAITGIATTQHLPGYVNIDAVRVWT